VPPQPNSPSENVEDRQKSTKKERITAIQEEIPKVEPKNSDKTITRFV
jgi:hypothetical protein